VMQNIFKKTVKKIFCHTNFTNLCSLHFAIYVLLSFRNESAGSTSSGHESLQIPETNDTYL